MVIFLNDAPTRHLFLSCNVESQFSKNISTHFTATKLLIRVEKIHTISHPTFIPWIYQFLFTRISRIVLAIQAECLDKNYHLTVQTTESTICCFLNLDWEPLALPWQKIRISFVSFHCQVQTNSQLGWCPPPSSVRSVPQDCDRPSLLGHLH